ncbi:MAG: hypothetical protein HZB67_00615, partial [Candidatus Aenigmarchaeota archaeon]|nr:hypothetical protein [Candidatus Aenigmarchaeota archaeon]
MKKEIIALMTFLLFVATASAYYYDYYQYYDAYPYYTYVDYYSYQPYYEYYPSGYDSYYFYYEESPQYEDTHYTDIANCQNPYGTEGQKKCFDSALYVCSRGGWSFDRDVQCCSADECQPEQLGDYCYSAKSCSSYQCSSGYQTYCPQPGTKKGSTCYYGDRECTKSGCSIQKCILQRDQRCDAWQGCVDVQCDAAECDAKDGWYCLGGDVTREYRDYYCTHDTGQSCSYRISDRETKTDEWVCDGDYRERVHYTCTNGNIYSSITSSTFCEDGCSSGQCMDDNEDCDGR